ncbi:EthD family reductase [Halopelagius longus]|nr:EthD family reductase [Halopelagius longus]
MVPNVMVCKMVILARRREDMSHEECIEYMEEEHAPLVQELPGLRKYQSSVPLNPDEAGFDEMAQLWFDSPEEMNDAFESEAGRRVQEDAENFLDADSALMIPVADETVRVNELD